MIFYSNMPPLNFLLIFLEAVDLRHMHIWNCLSLIRYMATARTVLICVALTLGLEPDGKAVQVEDM